MRGDRATGPVSASEAFLALEDFERGAPFRLAAFQDFGGQSRQPTFSSRPSSSTAVSSAPGAANSPSVPPGVVANGAARSKAESRRQAGSCQSKS